LNSPDFGEMLEDALEHLWEFSYLGQSPLARLKSVNRALPQDSPWSHVDRGRALHTILQEAIEQLKPTEQQLNLSREAAYYPILHRAYVEGVDNKAIAQTAGISLRTFYRQRTEAIRAVAQILRDWES
jgi:hypothetical protein